MQPNGPLWGYLALVPLAASALLALLLLVAAFTLRKRTLRIRIPARLESIRSLNALVDQMAREAKLNEQAIFQLRLALDEALANIINHSYADDPSGEIEAVIEVENGACTIRLTDYGEPYDPSAVNAPRFAGSLDDIRPGGLGLHLMRSVMDEVRYTPSPRGNRLVMTKHSHSRQPAG